MMFGCDPASGVPANTKLVKLIVEHLFDQFNPEDGSALLPDCFGVIDAMEEEVALESTSCNLGRNLLLHRQDNRINCKQIIVIAQNPLQSEEAKVSSDEIKVHERTQMVIDFFKAKLGFKQTEIIYFTESEVRSLVRLLDQS